MQIFKLNFDQAHPPTGCPANDFHLNMSDGNPETLEKHAKLWDAWMAEHPDDPTGKKYLDKYAEAKDIPPVVEETFPIAEKPGKLKGPPTKLSKRPKKYVQFYLPVDLAQAFKEECEVNRRAKMSTVIEKLIEGWLDGDTLF